MIPIQVSKALFERVDDDLLDRWELRIFVYGEGFEERAIGVRATVGNEEVEGIMFSPDGTGFTGFLRDEPSEGARLRVGDDAGLKDTAVTYHGPPMPPIPPVQEPNV